MSIDVVVVEDEPVARGVIREFVAGVPGLRLTGEADNAETAVPMIDRLAPHLLFLDVHLPGASGLDVLERIRHRTAVVFTTAYERYAISALQAGAVDYLVKPFGPARLREALERARPRIAAGVHDSGLAARIHELSVPSRWRRVFVRQGPRVVAVELATVVRIEAADDYVTLHAGASGYLLEMTMSEIERRLAPDTFVRIHRSHIVNLNYVRCVSSYDGRRLAVALLDGTTLVTSRAGVPRLRRLLD